MKVIVREASAEVAKISYEGKSFEVTRQKAIVESDNGDLRAPISLSLKSGQQPYAVGTYRVGDESFIVNGKYQTLELARELQLLPLDVSKSTMQAVK